MRFLRRFAKNRNGWNLGEKVYEKLSSLDPDPRDVAALIHEQTYIEKSGKK